MNKIHAPDLQADADALLDAIRGARAVVIGTVDGFDIAHAGRRPPEPARVAAMTSSLAALADAASRESKIGAPRCLVIDCADGRLVLRCVQRRGEALVVAVLTDPDALLGSVLHQLTDLQARLAAR